MGKKINTSPFHSCREDFRGTAGGITIHEILKIRPPAGSFFQTKNKLMGAYWEQAKHNWSIAVAE